MSYRIESYSLNELHRIAAPGAVTPSLFWALPVGNWRPGELDEVWRWFTQRGSACYDYGLLLVKDLGRGHADAGDVNLASVGARLADLMPTGAERFMSPSELRQDSRRVLVLSGGYPQPGWGVLLEWQGDVRSVEDLIRRVNARLAKEASFAAGLEVFAEAARSFHLWRNLRAQPELPDLKSLERSILEAEKAVAALREVRAALDATDYRMVGEKLPAATRGVEQAAWLEIPKASLQPMVDSQHTLRTALNILAIPAETLASEVEPKLAALVADPSKREAAYQNVPNEQIKHALRGCLHLRRNGIVGEGGNFRSWAEQTVGELPPRLAADVEKIAQDIVTKLTARRGEHAQIQRDHELAVERWRQNSREARDAFHRSAEKAAELQWQLGPQFLVTLEDICREDGLWARSIPWDPARMVGWKIMVRQVRLESGDLQVAARELAPGMVDDVPGNGHGTGPADGSYFTDYVHYIAISKPGFSPRSVTRDLVARLLRPAEMSQLIKRQGRQAPEGADAPSLAEVLLDSFGWRPSDEVREKPLAGWIKTAAGGVLTLPDGISGNDLRIVLESFCKDLLDVVVAQLGYRHDEIWNAIIERVPDYRPLSKQRDWDEEVRHMTVGPAVMLLPALGSLAFPAHQNVIKECAAGLRKLSETLNQASHHRGDEPAPAAGLDEAPALIQQVLTKAREFLGELPWHLHASFVYGEQPKVVSGEAWSHGSAAPRLLRVILWNGAAPGPHVLLWNKTRRNPIITDPVFIVRPHPSNLTQPPR